MTQTDRLNRIRLWASERGIILHRNNVGVLDDKKGNHVRYGLAVGSGDLIGWKSIIVRPEMVGKRIAIFVSVEDKSEKDVATEAQLRWQEAVRESGGIAEIVTDVKELDGIL